MVQEIGFRISSDTRKAQNDIDKLDRKLDKTEQSVKSLAKSSVSAFKNFSFYAGAATTSLAAVAVASAKSEREIAKFARMTRLTTEEFKALDFAAKQYGMTGEQIADISKDIRDRIGEFSTTGTGTFQDVADVLGITADQAKILSSQIQNLSGPAAIRFLISEMEKAGATASQMTWALESMGNDLSTLIPLFAKNGEQINDLTSKYKEAAEGIRLSTGQKEALSDLSTSWDLLTASVSESAKIISADFSPVMKDIFDYMIEKIPTATTLLSDYVNKFKQIENVKDIGFIERQIILVKNAIEDIKTTDGVFDWLADKFIANKEVLEANLKRLIEQKEKLIVEPAVASETYTANETKKINLEFDTTDPSTLLHRDSEKALERERELEAEADYMREYEAQRADFYSNLDEMAEDHAKRKEQIEKAQYRTAAMYAKKGTQDVLELLENGDREKTALYKTMFALNKAISIAEMIVNTEQAATEALAYGGPAGPALAGTIRAMGYTSVGIAAGTSIAEMSGGRASGGQVMGGNSYRAGEIGPEIFTDRQGRTTLIPGPEGGTVTPVKQAAPASKMSVIVNNNAPGVEVQTNKINDSEIELIIQRASDTVRAEFSGSLSSGYGEYSDAIKLAQGF